MLGVPHAIKVAADVAAAEWLIARLWPWPTPENQVLAGSIIPAGFGAYAAIRHESGEADDLSKRECDALVATLTDFTTTPDECWFCLWTGYGHIDMSDAERSIVGATDREYLLLRGPLAAVAGFDHVRPHYWWPTDRSWCVGGDVDLARTFVGGSEDAVDALAARQELDVERVPLDVRVDGTNDRARLG